MKCRGCREWYNLGRGDLNRDRDVWDKWAAFQRYQLLRPQGLKPQTSVSFPTSLSGFQIQYQLPVPGHSAFSSLALQGHIPFLSTRIVRFCRLLPCEDAFQNSGNKDDEDIKWGMDDHMRLEHHVALIQHSYDTAAL
jgi:hypothetical protein